MKEQNGTQDNGWDVVLVTKSAREAFYAMKNERMGTRFETKIDETPDGYVVSRREN